MPEAPPLMKVGDRARIVEKLFPSFDEGLFNGQAKTATIIRVDADSILPYQATVDGFEHHPFWFYQNQLEPLEAQEAKAE